MGRGHRRAGEGRRGRGRGRRGWRSSGSPPTSAATAGVARMSRPRDDRGHPGGGQHSRHGEGRGSDTSWRARVLEALEVDYVDESEVLTPADESNHIDKWAFKVPFVCGATNLGEALRRHRRGCRDDPLQGRGWHGRHRRGGSATCAKITGRDPPALQTLAAEELATAAKEPRSAAGHRAGGRRERAPVGGAVSAPGGIATPADAALMMALGAEGVFVGSGIFKSEDPSTRGRGRSSRPPTHWQDSGRVADASRGPRHADGQSRELEARGRAASGTNAAGSGTIRAPWVGGPPASGHMSRPPGHRVRRPADRRCWRCKAASRRTSACCEDSGARHPAGGAPPATSKASRGWCCPGASRRR